MKFVALIIGLILFYLLGFMKKKGLSFGTRVISGAALGLILGFLFKNQTEYLAVFGRIYANLLFAMVIPLLLTSVIKIMVSSESLQKLKSMGLKTVGILSLHNVLGSLIGVLLAVLFKIGKDANFPLNKSSDVAEVPGFAEAFASSGNFSVSFLSIIARNSSAVFAVLSFAVNSSSISNCISLASTSR